MATIQPSLENIERLKTPLTPGERFLAQYLVEQLSDEYEVYLQPFFNGDKPDVVIMKKGAGVVIVEVKNWQLQAYCVNDDNQWFVKNKPDNEIISPMQQVRRYKENMFKMHIDTLTMRENNHQLAQNKPKQEQLRQLISTFVYFDQTSKNELNCLYDSDLKKNTQQRNDLNGQHKNKLITYREYKRQIQDDKEIAFADECDLLKKIKEKLSENNTLFDETIYREFMRHLQPAFHTLQEGKTIFLGKKQNRLAKSQGGLYKIKGVAGSGKTTVLAHRAVSAHQRHQGLVLILTYNITLRNVIRQQLNDVCADFSWGAFAISNYHSWIMQHKCKKDIDNIDDAFFSDINIFESHHHLTKYQTILIDEIQDYKPEWVNIIHKYFLAEGGEMVLFGDEAQKIYRHGFDSNNLKMFSGFGEWEKMTKSYRLNHQLSIMLKMFQERFLLPQSNIDLIETTPVQMPLSLGDVLQFATIPCPFQIQEVAQFIIRWVRKHQIHPSDVAILASKIPFLRNLEFEIQQQSGEKVQTVFENKEEDQLLDDNKKLTEEIRRYKKKKFMLNQSLMTISTIHSFKGLEAPTVFYIAFSDDDAQIIYTALSRAKINLIVLIGKDLSKYTEFLKQVPNMQEKRLEAA